MLDDHFDGGISRPQHRAAETGAAARPLPLTGTELAALGELADRLARAVVLDQMGLDPALGDTPRDFVVVLMPDGRVEECVLPRRTAPLIAFAARDLLRECGVASRVVAGTAAWSVGPGPLDTLDHGLRALSRDPALLVSRGMCHTWLDIGGHLVDLAARCLPVKLEVAHDEQPFSTPPHRWRRFPRVIVHPAGAPMPDVERDAQAAYTYRPGSPELLRRLRRRLAPALAELETHRGANRRRKRRR